MCAGVFTMTICFFSDRLHLRGPFVVLCATISMIGYIITYTTSQPGPGYIAIVFAASGVAPTGPLVIAWTGGNAGGNIKRAVVLALVIGLGSLGGCVFHLTVAKVAGDGHTHNWNSTPQNLCLIHILSTTTFSYGPHHSDGLPWYEVCTDTSSPGGNKSFGLRNG